MLGWSLAALVAWLLGGWLLCSAPVSCFGRRLLGRLFGSLVGYLAGWLVDWW